MTEQSEPTAVAEQVPEPGQEAEPEPLAVEDLPGGLPAALEAILMVVDQPVSELELAAALNRPLAQVRGALDQLRGEYDGYTGTAVPDADGSDPQGTVSMRPRGFELRSVAGGWRFYSRSDFAPLVSRFVLEGQTARLTQAALETLAVIAYRQPVSRARISAIRGVNVDSVVRTLTQRGLITELETDPETGAILYGTTSYFLERLGLKSVDELPQIAPHLPGLENLDDFTQD
ncbi:segregation and condensation protein B [Psychromicrobium silvestre]|uniref:Segregation and condensation protein B n=1 Tax=Psychromicrobium silvestre TaxID=1645614 RepID=A0A7Y9S561_9MICC|nr:SMC-Scp complex subunit ScpB [Psychromicrobium silvestre]NYE93861.1 segregation and condensation protein B [Psychromicrobium silvestre]